MEFESWDLTSDHFRFLAPGGIVLPPHPMTKRSLLSLASKMFYPLGLISPFTVRAKVLFQKLWLKGVLWDDPLDSETKEKVATLEVRLVATESRGHTPMLRKWHPARV